MVGRQGQQNWWCFTSFCWCQIQHILIQIFFVECFWNFLFICLKFQNGFTLTSSNNEKRCSSFSPFFFSPKPQFFPPSSRRSSNRGKHLWMKYSWKIVWNCHLDTKFAQGCNNCKSCNKRKWLVFFLVGLWESEWPKWWELNGLWVIYNFSFSIEWVQCKGASLKLTTSMLHSCAYKSPCWVSLFSEFWSC